MSGFGVRGRKVPEPLQHGLCRSGKVRFPSKAAAEKKVKRLGKKPNSNPDKHLRRVYPCWHCKGWHFTSEEFDV